MRLWALLLSAGFGLAACPTSAWPQTSLQISFNAPVTTGDYALPRFKTLGDWGSACPREDRTIRWTGSIEWGDGVSTAWDADGMGPFAGAHQYTVPGRYLVRARRDWVLWPLNDDGYRVPDNGVCSVLSGTHEASVVLEVLPSAGEPENGTLGVYGDVAGSICAVPGAPVSELFVVAKPKGRSADGIGGAEFRLRNPGQLVLSTNPMPGWIAIGDPLGDGVTMARACGDDDQASAAMLRILAVPTTAGGTGSVFVLPHVAPSNPNNAGLSLTLCDAPAFSVVPTESWHAALVGAPQQVSCQARPTAVESTDWGRLKALYR